MWIVFNLTAYGDGVYFGGIYRSEEKAAERLQWCEEHLVDDADSDSWRMRYVPTRVPKTYNATFS